MPNHRPLRRDSMPGRPIQRKPDIIPGRPVREDNTESKGAPPIAEINDASPAAKRVHTGASSGSSGKSTAANTSDQQKAADFSPARGKDIDHLSKKYLELLLDRNPGIAGANWRQVAAENNSSSAAQECRQEIQKCMDEKIIIFDDGKPKSKADAVKYYTAQIEALEAMPPVPPISTATSTAKSAEDAPAAPETAETLTEAAENAVRAAAAEVDGLRTLAAPPAVSNGDFQKEFLGKVGVHLKQFEKCYQKLLQKRPAGTKETQTSSSSSSSSSDTQADSSQLTDEEFSQIHGRLLRAFQDIFVAAVVRADVFFKKEAPEKLAMWMTHTMRVRPSNLTDMQHQDNAWDLSAEAPLVFTPEDSAYCMIANGGPLLLPFFEPLVDHLMDYYEQYRQRKVGVHGLSVLAGTIQNLEQYVCSCTHCRQLANFYANDDANFHDEIQIFGNEEELAHIWETKLRGSKTNCQNIHLREQLCKPKNLWYAQGWGYFKFQLPLCPFGGNTHGSPGRVVLDELQKWKKQLSDEKNSLPFGRVPFSSARPEDAQKSGASPTTKRVRLSNA